MIGYPDGFSRPVILALYQMIADFIQSGLLDLMIPECQLVASMVRNLDFVVNSRSIYANSWHSPMILRVHANCKARCYGLATLIFTKTEAHLAYFLFKSYWSLWNKIVIMGILLFSYFSQYLKRRFHSEQIKWGNLGNGYKVYTYTSWNYIMPRLILNWFPSILYFFLSISPCPPLAWLC